MRNQGDDLEWVARQAARRGVAPPDILKDRPELRPDLLFYWTAFNDLCSERTSLGYLPIRAIFDYADRYGMPGELFRVIMQAMDRTWARSRTSG